MPVVVSQAPPPAADNDIESALRRPNAAVHNVGGRDQREQRPADDRPTPIVEVEAEHDGGARRPASDPTVGSTTLGFFVLVFAAVVSLVFLVSDLINKRPVNPISAGTFMMCGCLCVVVLKRDPSRPDTPGRRPNLLTKEAREELLTYFVFDCPTAAAAAAGGEDGAAAAVEGDAGKSEMQQQHEKQRQGKDVPSDDGGSGSMWCRRDVRSRGDGGTERSGGGGNGGKWDDRIDADTESVLIQTPAATPCPRYPLPPEPQSLQRFSDHAHCGDGSGADGGDSAAGCDTCAATSGVVARIGGGQLQEQEEENEEEAEKATVGVGRCNGCEQPLRSGPESCEARDSVVVAGTTAGNNAAAAAPITTTATTTVGSMPEDDAGATHPDAVTGRASASTTTSADGAEADGLGMRHSDSQEWSTGQSCIVCFGDYCSGELLCRMPCRHVYHARCIDEWLDQARPPCCPLCKTDLRLVASPDGCSNGSRSNSSTIADGATRDGAAAPGEQEFASDNAV